MVKNKKIWINGTFDVLHFGHLKLLEYASSLGYLKIGIDSDDRVKLLKGKERPFNDQEKRKFFLESLKFVNEVVIFNNENDLIKKIKDYKPEIMVIGDDYKLENIIGHEFIKNIIFFNKIKNISTTKILNYGK